MYSIYCKLYSAYCTLEIKKCTVYIQYSLVMVGNRVNLSQVVYKWVTGNRSVGVNGALLFSLGKRVGKEIQGPREISKPALLVN